MESRAFLAAVCAKPVDFSSEPGSLRHYVDPSEPRRPRYYADDEKFVASPAFVGKSDTLVLIDLSKLDHSQWPHWLKEQPNKGARWRWYVENDKPGFKGFGEGRVVPSKTKGLECLRRDFLWA